MNTKIIFALCVVAIFVLPSATIAAHHKGGGHCMMSSWDMNDLDTDNDGEISFEEYVQPHTEKMRSGFDMIDSNGDGVIGEAEWEELLNVHGFENDR